MEFYVAVAQFSTKSLSVDMLIKDALPLIYYIDKILSVHNGD